MRVTNTQSNPTSSFGKFIKIKGKTTHLEHFREQLKTTTKKEFVTFIKCTGTEKGKLYILSGKDFDKFIDYIRQNSCLIDFRRKPAKFLNKKPLSLKIHEAHEKLKNKKLL